MRQHGTDGSFRFCRWRAHTEAWSEDSGPEALSTQGQYFALHVFSAILPHIAGELSANCCRTITMTFYSKRGLAYESATILTQKRDIYPVGLTACRGDSWRDTVKNQPDDGPIPHVRRPRWPS